MPRRWYLLVLVTMIIAASSALVVLWPRPTEESRLASSDEAGEPRLETQSPVVANDGLLTRDEPTGPSVDERAVTIDVDTARRPVVETQNVDTLRRLVAETPRHDLTLLASVERFGGEGAREAAEQLFRLRDERAERAALESHARQHLAHPPRLHAATRRWLDDELGIDSESDEVNERPEGQRPEGRGPAIKRFRRASR